MTQTKVHGRTGDLFTRSLCKTTIRTSAVDIVGPQLMRLLALEACKSALLTMPVKHEREAEDQTRRRLQNHTHTTKQHSI